jgi:antitoxin component of MazEF toxin-antitoxin module
MKSTSNLSNGRAVIPAAMRAQLNMMDGDQLLWRVQNGELIATTQRAQLQKAQALFQSYLPINSTSLADELIAERRLDAARP